MCFLLWAVSANFSSSFDCSFVAFLVSIFVAKEAWSEACFLFIRKSDRRSHHSTTSAETIGQLLLTSLHGNPVYGQGPPGGVGEVGGHNRPPPRVDHQHCSAHLVSSVFTKLPATLKV
eukprot:GFUD01089521.1.p1 GENE.GFUD01089521.1~~GFUD01089521.1.p1  ORF type:complete len:118 (-),score=14.79 GFUD01089521.1:40-393(-)